MPAEGTFELCCHPGYNDSDLDRITTRLRAHRDIERNALLTEVPALVLHPNAPATHQLWGPRRTRRITQLAS